MADKSRLASPSFEKNEQLSTTFKSYKSKKEYKDKNVVKNAWKQVAEKLEFLSDRKKKLIPFILIRQIRNFSKRNQ